MKIAGIVLDDYKRDKFRQSLRSADFEFTEHPTPLDSTTTFKVNFDGCDLPALHDLVRATNRQSRK